jgi:hypothetical protein
MTPATLQAQCRAAYAHGKAKTAQSLADNPILDIIRYFTTDKRVTKFEEEDFPFALEENSETLLDAYHLQEASRDLVSFITTLTGLNKQMLDRADKIITQYHESGVTEEGFFRINAQTRHANGTLNEEGFKADRQDLWDFLLKQKHDTLDQTFKPTLTEVRALLKKKAEQYIIPGKEYVTGLELVLIDPPQEKTSTGVDP